MKYLRSTTLRCKYIGIKTLEFLAYTQFLYVKSDFTGPNKRHIYYPWPRIKMAKIEVLWASIYRWIIPLIVKIFIECLIWVNRPQIYVILVTFIHQENWKCTRINLNIVCLNQGYKARKVISEVYAFFVLQCTVFGRKSKHKTDVTAWHGIHFPKNNLWNILVIGNYYVNYQNYQN